jgi:class 3 adenylate cyclase/tetratricopeptide (TPR) repeat protein
VRFCTECGTPVEGIAAPTAAAALPAPDTERRLCSVLFVDLVGFTPLSEGRDPEEVRELLSRYFDIARTVVGRYGGVIEKFIGDAVMAVWGTPVAVEGDAERAVRAAMELTAEVSALGHQVGAPGLAARAGVVTGTVAATLAADGQAMVAGDAVNTAARVQSAAPAGGVLVDTATRRLAGLAIDFDLHGDVELKGKAEPETLWHAREVVSGIGGAQRSDGLEAPFVGRTVELGLMKELLHATTRERRPHLALVSGPAGVGKSRLGWELEKYVDGLAETVYWHRGSCPRFGEDTAYWALTEIVRARLVIGDDDDRRTIEDKLSRYLAGLFDADGDRAFVATRLAPLLGLTAPSGELARADLFAGWRRFFEGLAQRQTVLLLVEDLHDADDGLLDFLEHLVDWVRDLPVLVIGFARPELVEERPGLAAGRNRSLISLAPLGGVDMRALLAGLVEQIPVEAAQAIEAQAQGIPLFAVETVRSLIDQQVVVATDDGYTLKGDVGALTLPESLHALLAARLDALDPLARSLAGDAAVIAAPFTAETLVEVSGLDAGQVQAGLSELAHRDVLQISADALSPQIGAYSFTHGLLAQVAYQTLSHKDLKERHLRVADHLASSTRNEGDALAEVIARHHLDALEARPNDDDVASVRAGAVEWLVRAAERARSTGAQATAARLFSSAAELTGETDEAAALRSADLWMQAAKAAYEETDYEQVFAAADRARRLRAAHGRDRLVAVIEGLRGRALRRAGQRDEAHEALLAAMEVLTSEPGLDTVEVAGALAAVCSFDEFGDGDERTAQAIALAERLAAGNRLLAEAFNSRGLYLGARGRRLEALGYFQQALGFAEAAQDMPAIAQALGNLADSHLFASPREALAYTLRGIEVARQVGARYNMGNNVANAVLCMLRLGEWDAAADAVDTALDRDGLGDIAEVTLAAALVWALRGDPARAREIFRPLRSVATDEQAEAYDQLIWALLAGAEGDPVAGLRHARRALEVLNTTSMDPFVLAWPLATRLAHEVSDGEALTWLRTMLDTHQIGEIPPLVRAERRLSEARLLDDPSTRVAAIEDAVTDLRAEGSPYHLALALLDLAEAQVAAGKDPADVVAEAASIGAVLRCPSVVDRADRLA